MHEIKEKETQLSTIATDLKTVTKERYLSEPEKMLLLKQKLVDERKKN